MGVVRPVRAGVVRVQLCHDKLANTSWPTNSGNYATMQIATAMWHHDLVTPEEALTEALAALADTSPDADEKRSLRAAAALYQLAKQGKRGWQADLVRQTGISRETIRRHVEDERIRRGEIPPTERYLKAQEAQARKRARRES